MANNSKTSEEYYKLLKKELKKCLNPYNQEKHLKYMGKVIDFQKWCSHKFDNGNTAIENGFDKGFSEGWSQCKLCKKNFS